MMHMWLFDKPALDPSCVGKKTPPCTSDINEHFSSKIKSFVPAITIKISYQQSQQPKYENPNQHFHFVVKWK